MVKRRHSFLGLDEGKFWALKDEALDLPNSSGSTTHHSKAPNPLPSKGPDRIPKATQKPANPPDPKPTKRPTAPPSTGPDPKTNKGSNFRSSLTEEEVARRAKLSNAEKQQEAREVRAAWEKNKQENWWQPRPSSKPTEPSATPPTPDPKPKTPKQPSAKAADQFYKSAADPEPTEKEPGQSAKQRKNEKRKKRTAEKEEKRQEQNERKRKTREAKREAERIARIEITHKERLSFETWSKTCADFFADSSHAFPEPPSYGCKKTNCIRGEHIAACHHEIERTMLGSGCYGTDWLKKERLKWHPDKFHGMGRTQTMASEMFVLIQRLVDGDQSKEE